MMKIFLKGVKLLQGYRTSVCVFVVVIFGDDVNKVFGHVGA